jgi:hypothetical protein
MQILNPSTMKNIYLIFCFVVISNLGFSQSPAPLMWGGSPFQDSLWAFDTITWAPTINVPAIVTGSVVDGINGLAYDPVTYKSYVILKISPSRYLAELSLPSGSCTVVGDLGDQFSSITFDKFGQLYGCTGDGASAPESFFMIDKATAASTLVFAMGNGLDGEVICYNRYDNKIYHWSGNGTLIYESWPVGSTSYTPTNITTSGTTGGETFGAICLGTTDFITSSISSEFRHTTTTGTYAAALNSTPDDIRGMIMPPRFSISTSTFCAGQGTLDIFANCLQLYDSVYYYWGDGNVTQLLATSAATAGASHNYGAPGNYTLTVQLYNGAVAKSTIKTFSISVINTPSVTITGSPYICPGGTATLTASGGGGSQWYSGGVAVPGATLNTFTTTTVGWYNMIKTNLNGCSDSASTGVQVTVASAPTVAATGTVICSGSSATITLSGASTYTVTGGSNVVSPTVTTSYSVTGTNTAGCVSGNTAVVTVTVNPTPSLNITTTNTTICTGESATLTASGASIYVWTPSGNTNSIAVSPTITTSYTVTGTTDGCANTATVSQEVSECIGILKNSRPAVSVRVTPNPSTGKFMVENIADNAQVEVYNGLGQLILKTNAHTGNASIDLSAYSDGMYIVTVNQDQKIIAQIKVIKQ